jgi:hypothetical protein
MGLMVLSEAAEQIVFPLVGSGALNYEDNTIALEGMRAVTDYFTTDLDPEDAADRRAHYTYVTFLVEDDRRLAPDAIKRAWVHAWK